MQTWCILMCHPPTRIHSTASSHCTAHQVHPAFLGKNWNQCGMEICQNFQIWDFLEQEMQWLVKRQKWFRALTDWHHQAPPTRRLPTFKPARATLLRNCLKLKPCVDFFESWLSNVKIGRRCDQVTRPSHTFCKSACMPRFLFNLLPAPESLNQTLALYFSLVRSTFVQWFNWLLLSLLKFCAACNLGDCVPTHFLKAITNIFTSRRQSWQSTQLTHLRWNQQCGQFSPFWQLLEQWQQCVVERTIVATI